MSGLSLFVRGARGRLLLAGALALVLAFAVQSGGRMFGGVASAGRPAAPCPSIA
jgi:hypothetical protein